MDEVSMQQVWVLPLRATLDQLVDLVWKYGVTEQLPDPVIRIRATPEHDRVYVYADLYDIYQDDRLLHDQLAGYLDPVPDLVLGLAVTGPGCDWQEKVIAGIYQFACQWGLPALVVVDQQVVVNQPIMVETRRLQDATTEIPTINPLLPKYKAKRQDWLLIWREWCAFEKVNKGLDEQSIYVGPVGTLAKQEFCALFNSKHKALKCSVHTLNKVILAGRAKVDWQV